MINKLRSYIFDAVQILTTALFVIFFLLMMPFPWQWMQSGINVWARTIRLQARFMVGIGVRVVGLENVPEGPVIIASKHLSIWDTSFYQVLFPRTVYVMKKELLSIPIWGWTARKIRSISVDRSGGSSAMKKLIADTTARLDEGRKVIIFPEGTRMRPGQQTDFHPGIAAMYKYNNVPVVPVILNSGLFWGRNNIGEKTSGVITVEFLPAIEPGRDRKVFMHDLQACINEGTARLDAEARSEFPILGPAQITGQ